MKRSIEVSPYSGIEEDVEINQAGSGNIADLGVDHPDRLVAKRAYVYPYDKKRGLV